MNCTLLGVDPTPRRGRPELNSLEAVLEVLGDGGWHPKRTVRRAAGGPNDTTFDMVLHYLKVAESDHGTYLCLPTEETPLAAPDEEDER